MKSSFTTYYDPSIQGKNCCFRSLDQFRSHQPVRAVLKKLHANTSEADITRSDELFFFREARAHWIFVSHERLARLSVAAFVFFIAAIKRTEI